MLRLARSSRVASYRRGAMIQTQGSALDAIAVIVSGSIRASALNPDGKRHTVALRHSRGRGLRARIMFIGP